LSRAAFCTPQADCLLTLNASEDNRRLNHMPRSYTKNRQSVAIERLAYSVPQLCDAASISPETFFRLKREGKGPRTFNIGTKLLCTSEDAKAWIAALRDAEHTPTAA
jgi:hypothetical protein